MLIIGLEAEFIGSATEAPLTAAYIQGTFCVVAVLSTFCNGVTVADAIVVTTPVGSEATTA
jgi:hypothetical protein